MAIPFLNSRMILVACIWLMSGGTFVIHAETPSRVALVVGNAKYDAAVGKLRNTPQDAKAMAAVLRSLGFKVIEKHDLSRDRFISTMDQFRLSLRGAEVAVFYYAGHGLAVGGSNYLVPVRAEFDSAGADAVTLRMLAETRLLNADQVVADMVHGGARCNLIILDACRTTLLSMPSATRSSLTGSGLVKMSPPTGSLIAFATDSGEVAFDGEGANGIFTGELIRHLQTPGISIEQVFKRTREGVLALTNGKQVPAEYSRLTGEDIFLAGPVKEEIAPMVQSGTNAPAAGLSGVPMSRTILPRVEDLVQAAGRGELQAALNSLQMIASMEGKGDYAAAPLEAVLERVKTDLEDSENPAHAAVAAMTCERVLELLPEVLPATHPQYGQFASKAHNRRGTALRFLGSTAEAIEAYHEAHRLVPTDAFILYNRGIAYQEIGEVGKSRADLSAAADPELRQPKARALAEAALRELEAQSVSTP